LAKLGQVEPTKYAFGQQQGSVGLSFVWDDADTYKLFQSVYGAPSGSAASWVYPSGSTTPYSHSVAPAPTSLMTQIQLQTGTSTLTRTLKGCVVNSLGLSTSIGETVNGTIDMTYGKEDTTVLASSDTITEQTHASYDQGGTPYTFAHGELKINTGSGLTEVAQVQEVDVSFSQNSELLYKLGQHHATDMFRRVFDISGRFKTTWKDSTLIQHVISQSNLTTPVETLSGTNATAVEMSLTFTSGNKSITLQFGGVAINDQSVSGIEPVEPVFEELNWSARTARIVVDTTA
jgi:hypothetical protein